MTIYSMTSKTRSRSTRSLFATSLGDLIDQTGIFSRSEWSTTLGVTSAAISQWINDKTVPRPRALRSLIDVVRRYRGPDNQHLTAFLAIADEPAGKVSPHGARLGPSVGRYLVSPVLDGFLGQLDVLSYSIQEAVLSNAIAECERLREASEREAHQERPDVKSVSASPPVLPVSSSDPFIGRDAELRQVRNSLSDGMPVALFGTTGVGKTALAAEVVRRLFGGAPCQAIRRFEFKKYHDLPWSELLESIAPFADASNHGHGNFTLHAHQNVFFVFDDVDMADNTQRDVLATFLRRCANAGPRLKVMVTYGSDRSPDVRPLPDMDYSRVYLSRLREEDIAQLWSVLLTSVTRASVRYATWLTAGSPGYCRQLAERARACTATDKTITEYDVVEASMLLLSDTEGGLAAKEALDPASREAQSVALWSAMQDETLGAEELGLPKFYQAVNNFNGSGSDALSKAIEEATRRNLVESVSIGDRPAITLKNESYRPYFRSVALNRFRRVQEALEREQAVA